MEATIFRPVPSYTDLYAGMDGRIIHGGKGKRLTQTVTRHGYLVVHIPGVKCQKRVHRLVAEAFLGPCPNGMEVRHADGVRTNNHLGNLCYGTPRDNTQDAMRHGTHQGALMSAKTKCPEGHDYSPDNTYVHPTTGSRHCRLCRTAYQQRYWGESRQHRGRFTSDEKREMAKRLLVSEPWLTDKQIATRTGMGISSVRYHRHKLFPDVSDRRVRRNRAPTMKSRSIND